MSSIAIFSMLLGYLTDILKLSHGTLRFSLFPGTPGHLHRQVTSAAGSVSGDVQPPMGIDLIVKQYIFPINRDMYVSIYIRIYPCFPAALQIYQKFP